MGRNEGSPTDRQVMLSAPSVDLVELRAVAPELDVVVSKPNEVARRSLDLQSAVVVLDDADTARGLRTVQALRRARSAVRIVFVTPAEAKSTRLEALEAGVDEALPCSLTISELAGRIRLLLRRPRTARRSRLRVGDDLELDLDHRELLRDGRWIHLRPKEAGLLELFARSPGKVLRRGHILERVWGPNHTGDPRTVDVHVRWLRAKIEPDPHAPVHLLTVRGAGYRLEPAPLTEC